MIPRGYVSLLMLVFLLAPVARGSDSIVFMDGMAVDLMKDTARSEPFFRGGLPRLPFAQAEPRVRGGARQREGGAGVKAANLSSEAAKHSRLAERYIQEKQWPEARRELERALSLEPGNMELTRRMATVCSLAGQYGTADAYFRLYLSANPNDSSFLVGWASTLIRLKRYDDADDALRRAQAIDQTDLTARFNVEMLRLIRGAEAPGDSHWKSMTLVDAFQLANWLEADKKAYIEVLGKDGFSRFCDWVLGNGSASRLQSIINEIRRVRSRVASGDWLGALEAVENLHALGFECAGLALNAAKCRFELGERDEALASFAELVEEYPDSGMLWYGYGYALIEMAEYKKGIEVFSRAAELMPNNPVSRFAIACCYAGLSRMDEAWPLLEELSRTNGFAMRSWLNGDAPYLDKIKEDPRFADLEKEL